MQKTPGYPGVLVVAPTGIDPVTFRFSVRLGGFRHCSYGCDIALIRDSSKRSQLVSVGFRAFNGTLMAQDPAASRVGRKHDWCDLTDSTCG